MQPACNSILEASEAGFHRCCVSYATVGTWTDEPMDSSEEKFQELYFVVYIYGYYLNIENRKKLHFHPDKPVSWFLTLQGILKMSSTLLYQALYYGKIKTQIS